MEVEMATEEEVTAAAEELFGEKDADFSEFFAPEIHFALKYGNAIALFEHVGEGKHRNAPVYNGHFLFDDETRGSAAVEAANKMIDTVFTLFDADGITGEIPRDNRAARVMTSRLGFKPYNAAVNDFGQSCIYYIMDRETWATSLTQAGKQISTPSQALII